jgi:hypothetical protein
MVAHIRHHGPLLSLPTAAIFFSFGNAMQHAGVDNVVSETCDAEFILYITLGGPTCSTLRRRLQRGYKVLLAQYLTP